MRNIYAKYIYLLEKRAIRIVNNINAFSNEDYLNFNNLYKIPNNKIIINSMGYIQDIYNNPLKKEIARKSLNIDINKFVVIFHGNYYRNVASKEAIQIIKNKIAPKINNDDILILIAGNTPNFPNTNNLKFLGFVKDLISFLYSADVAVAPILRGSGVRIKIIDYLSSRIPIIATSKAVEGIFFKNGVHGYIVNKTDIIDQFISKIFELKNKPNKIEKMKQNIDILLEEHYNETKSKKNLDRKYREIVMQHLIDK